MFSIGSLCTWAFPGFEYSVGRSWGWQFGHTLVVRTPIFVLRSQQCTFPRLPQSFLFMTSMTLVPSHGPYMKINQFPRHVESKMSCFLYFQTGDHQSQGTEGLNHLLPRWVPTLPIFISCIQATERWSHFFPKWVSIYLITNLTRFLRN